MRSALSLHKMKNKIGLTQKLAMVFRPLGAANGRDAQRL